MTVDPSQNEIRAAQRRASFSRRHFLRGVGACIALPAMGSLRPIQAWAGPTAPATNLAATATGAPLRTAFLFFPNGAIPSAWLPKTEGSEFPISPTLKPLDKHRQFVQVLSGLDHKFAEGGPDGSGDHARGNSVFLTGVRLKKSASDVRAGVSIDQVIAKHVGHLTRFPSLELTCDAQRKSGSCDSGYACTYQYNLSWGTPTTPMTPEANPRLAFERLFGTGAPGERWLNQQRRRQQQKSILDFVLDDTRAMQKQLDRNDQQKLDQYLTGVREIEARIQKAERFGEAADPGVPAPDGIPVSYGDYVRLMMDVLVLAFQTDSTRVSTLLLAHDGSNRSFDDIGIYEGHHDLTHHQNRPDWIAKVTEIDLWYVRQLATFLDKLDAVEDVDGKSLLHNSMIVYGGGNSDGNRHTHRNLPVVLAGGGGGTLIQNRHVNHRSKPMTNLFLSMTDRMGLALPRFGDSTGRLEDV